MQTCLRLPPRGMQSGNYLQKGVRRVTWMPVSVLSQLSHTALATIQCQYVSRGAAVKLAPSFSSCAAACAVTLVSDPRWGTLARLRLPHRPTSTRRCLRNGTLPPRHRCAPPRTDGAAGTRAGLVAAPPLTRRIAAAPVSRRVCEPQPRGERRRVAPPRRPLRRRLWRR